MSFLVPKCYLSLKLSSNFKIPDVLSSITSRRKGSCSTILPILHPLRSTSVLLCIPPDLVYSQCPGGIKVWSVVFWTTVMYTDNNISLRTDRHCASRVIPWLLLNPKWHLVPKPCPQFCMLGRCIKVVQFGGQLSCKASIQAPVYIWP